jgi:hypothetical protein
MVNKPSFRKVAGLPPLVTGCKLNGLLVGPVPISKSLVLDIVVFISVLKVTPSLTAAPPVTDTDSVLYTFPAR